MEQIISAKSEVSEFLDDFKMLAARGKLIIRERKDVRKSFISLGLTKQQAKKELFKLRVEDYVSGPNEDRTFADETVWVFGRKIEKKEAYIKLQIVKHPGSDFSVCISFHAAEHTLHYPYRES
jgi:Motility quorum-sensing regulator, toxin of MqsA